MRRVAITGAGVISPIGSTLEDFHAALVAGRWASANSRAKSRKGISGVEVGAMIDWDPSQFFTPVEAGGTDRASQFALAAAAQAIKASALDLETARSESASAFLGHGHGRCAYARCELQEDLRREHVAAASAHPRDGDGQCRRLQVAIRFGLRGAFANFSTACSSSSLALGEAMRTIAAGRADAMSRAGPNRCSRRGRSPRGRRCERWRPRSRRPGGELQAVRQKARGPRPRRRRGRFRPGERIARALARRAHTRLLTGYGNRCDAMHLASRHAGSGPRDARSARRSELSPRDIGYINAHGTATSVGDSSKPRRSTRFSAAAGRARELDQVAARPPARRRGRARARSGTVRARAGILPPTAFLEEPDPACGLRHVAESAERIPPPHAVMSNSFAFGGSNVVLVAARA